MENKKNTFIEYRGFYGDSRLYPFFKRYHMSDRERSLYDFACKLAYRRVKDEFLSLLTEENIPLNDVESLISIGQDETINMDDMQLHWLREYEKQLGTSGFAEAGHADTTIDAGKQRYFDEAVKAGFIEETDTGYKWRYPQNKPSKASLGYFISKIYRNESTPIKYLEGLFGVTRLDVAIYAERKFTQKWEEEINTIIDNVKACND